MLKNKNKIKIDHCEFGEIIVNGKKFYQIVISDNQVSERDEEKLEEAFHSSHFIGEWEKEALLAGKPEAIVIGNGFDGVLRVNDDLINEAKKRGIEIIIKRTPDAVNVYNQMVEEGKKVNCLIHTTC